MTASSTHSAATSVPTQLTIGGRPLKALVLAAGEGTRLRPLTLDRPKPMVPINGVPLLEIVLGWLRDAGVSDIAINLHYKPDAITQHFGDGAAFGVRLSYSHETRLMGSAGAARRLRDFAGDGPLLIAYGDVLTDLDLRQLARFHETQRASHLDLGASISLYRVSNPTEVGLVGVDASGRVTRFLEKPRQDQVFTDIANAGVCIVEPAVLDAIEPDVTCDFGLHVFPRMLEQGVPICGWLIPPETYLIDIGSPAKYEQANRDWAERASR